jgi:cytoskeletal protein CcmA (bactofilin family)
MKLSLVTPEALLAIDTVIDASARVSGNFHSTDAGGIRVDGRFKGTICLGPDSIVFISKEAVVEDADLCADVVVVAGYVQGRVTARKAFEAIDASEVRGAVECQGRLCLHPGSKMDALLSVSPSH